MNKHQSDGAKAGPSAYSLIEEKEDAYGKTEAAEKETFDEDISLEEALSTL